MVSMNHSQSNSGPLQPSLFGRKSVQYQLCTEVTCSTNTLANQLGGMGIEECHSGILSQHTQSYKGPPPLQLDTMLSSQFSQEMIGTPDYAVQEAQYIQEFNVAAHVQVEDEESRSPPELRHTKRPRNLEEFDSQSQASMSQSRSQGEPSTSSQAISAGMRSGRPPKPSVLVKLLQAVRNPYLTPGQRNDCTYGVTPALVPFTFRQRYVHEYETVAELGSGNFSVVLKAVHKISGKSYAIKRSKRPLTNFADKNQWLHEVQVLAAVEGHPNVITYYENWFEKDSQSTADYAYIKLELCDESLQAMQQRNTKFKEHELLTILRQVAAGLKHMHDLGLAHLDVKPDNIYRKGEECFKLGDFGLATRKDGSKWVNNEGDSRYLAPEILKTSTPHQLDKADMFALGATLYELATGNPLPKGGERYQEIRQGKLMMMPYISMKLQTIIRNLMSPDPAARPTAEQLLKSAVVQTKTLQLSPSPMQY